jgi:hypothetical protein
MSTTETTTQADADAIRATNDQHDVDFPGVNTNRSNDYWHARGQHNNGAIVSCAGCVADDNIRGLSGAQLSDRENRIDAGYAIIRKERRTERVAAAAEQAGLQADSYARALAALAEWREPETLGIAELKIAGLHLSDALQLVLRDLDLPRSFVTLNRVAMPAVDAIHDANLDAAVAAHDAGVTL